MTTLGNAIDPIEEPDLTITPPIAVKAVPPAGVSEEEAQRLREVAAEAVAKLRDTGGSQELQAVDSITAVGTQAQRRAGGDLELLRARVGEMMAGDGEGAGGRIAHDLVDLRVALQQIDPHRASQEGLIRRLVSFSPVGRKRLLRTLETIAVRYEPVSKQVVLLETRLREGRVLLERDNIELRKLYEHVEGQQLTIQRNCYLGEVLIERLDELLAETDEPQKRDRLQNALFDVATRVQDLRTMDEVHNQLFVSIDMTRQNNRRLGHAVDRSITLVSNVVMVGLAIQSALVRQWHVLDATRKTREFLGDVLTANAATIRRHTQEIGDLYNSPVIALDKITRAHDELLEALDIADGLRSEGIAAARENAIRLATLTSELQQRASLLAPVEESQTLEA
jgi:uncharacterized protein YaaN involved in tellurite resistance